MSFSIREKQIESLKRMLRLNYSKDSEEYWQNLWKVLIYDDYCKDIIAPLFSVDALRKQGITLHLSLNNPRQQVPDVPAVYFIQPTKENIARICQDCANKLYSSLYLNFSSSISRNSLEELATNALATDSVGLITKVYDQYLNFISLEDNLFTLKYPNSYFAFHNPSIADSEAVESIDKVVDALFSVVATLGKVPIIQCPKRGDAAELIATKLDEKLRDHLSNVGNLFTESPSSSLLTPGISSAASSSSYQRPVLILLDRNVDLSVMLSHSWSYQALVHDIFDMQLNRIRIKVKDKDGVETETSYSLDPTDPFLKEHAGSPFPKVAVSVHQKATEIESKVGKKSDDNGNKEDDDDPFQSARLIDKISALPELQEQKELVTMHINIARALLDAINSRALDVFFRLEESLITQSVHKKKDIMAAIEGEHGLPEDKLRLFLIYYIAHHKNIKESELAEFEAKLKECGCDLSSLQYLKAIKAFDNNLATTSTTQQYLQPSIAQDFFNLFGQYVSKGVEYLVPTMKNFYVTRVVDAIMDLKHDKLNASTQYLYFDPKFPNSTRKSTPFREAIVFVVGGGNYLEFQNLKDYVEKSKESGNNPMLGKKIIYGSTEILTGNQFLKQLAQLGQLQEK